MTKLFLLVPAGLLAISGVSILSLEYSKKEPTAVVQDAKSQNPAEIFRENEHLMRQIVRYGDQPSLDKLHQSLSRLDGFLAPYADQGIDTTKTDALVLQYVQDSIKVVQKAPAFMDKLKTTDGYERTNERRFIASLDQIGLFELHKGFETLEKARLEYIKKPSQSSEEAYKQSMSKVRTIITELYLDDAIEDPLFAYLDNHGRYFDTVVAMYKEVGIEKIDRIRTNAYAIHTELQLLPKI